MKKCQTCAVIECLFVFCVVRSSKCSSQLSAEGEGEAGIERNSVETFWFQSVNAVYAAWQCRMQPDGGGRIPTKRQMKKASRTHATSIEPTSLCQRDKRRLCRLRPVQPPPLPGRSLPTPLYTSSSSPKLASHLVLRRSASRRTITHPDRSINQINRTSNDQSCL